MEIVLSWKLLFSTRAWRSIRFSTQAPLHALLIPVLIGLCSYKNLLVIWGHNRKESHVYPICFCSSLFVCFVRHFEFSSGCRCTLVPRLPFPAPGPPFPVPRSRFLISGISNIPFGHGPHGLLTQRLFGLEEQLRSDIWNVSYIIELRIWNQVSYDHRSCDRNLGNCVWSHWRWELVICEF